MRSAISSASPGECAVPFSGWSQAEPGQQPLEPPPVLGQIDRIGRGAEDRDLGPLQRRREFQRGLPAELHDDAEKRAAALLDPDDLDHVLGRQRLEIEPVGGVVIGRDGLRDCN